MMALTLTHYVHAGAGRGLVELEAREHATLAVDRGAELEEDSARLSTGDVAMDRATT
jgi:hypothetical protein